MSQILITRRGSILIKEATPSDALPYRDLRLEALQESPTAFSADYQKNASYPSQYWVDRLTMPVDEAMIYLAQNENMLVGMSGIFRGDAPKTRHAATIWGVYIRPEWRGLHIAEELINACLAWARGRGIVGARLGVTATNISAIRCYERCGFKITGTEPRALYHEGSYLDFNLMYRPLDEDPSPKE